MAQIIENLKFEDLGAMFNLTGHVHFQEGPSTGRFPAENPPVEIVQSDQSSRLIIHWNSTGLLSPVFEGCTWHFDVYFEKMGPGEFALPGSHQHKVFQAGTDEMVINIAPNTVPPGVYRVVTSMYLTTARGYRLPVAAFTEVGMIQFYIA